VPRRTITPEIGEQIKVAHAAGIGLREFARNANIREGTVLSFAKRHGLTQQIATAKVAARPELARELAQPDAINAITPMQSVAATMMQRGQRHVERTADVTERVMPHLERMQPGDVLDGIHEIEKFDKMARRNYGLGDSTVGGSLSINVLTNQAGRDRQRQCLNAIRSNPACHLVDE
jgi:hypothetical protein